MPQIVKASYANETLCENNLNILKLLRWVRQCMNVRLCWRTFASTARKCSTSPESPWHNKRSKNWNRAIKRSFLMFLTWDRQINNTAMSYSYLQLCDFVIKNSQKVALLENTLDTLLRFLRWIPSAYVFETDLIAQLVTKVFEHNEWQRYYDSLHFISS